MQISNGFKGLCIIELYPCRLIDLNYGTVLTDERVQHTSHYTYTHDRQAVFSIFKRILK